MSETISTTYHYLEEITRMIAKLFADNAITYEEYTGLVDILHKIWKRLKEDEEE